MIADDERPARSFLAAMLRGFEDVEIVGEASSGSEALKTLGPARNSSVKLNSRYGVPSVVCIIFPQILRR